MQSKLYPKNNPEADESKDFIVISRLEINSNYLLLAYIFLFLYINKWKNRKRNRGYIQTGDVFTTVTLMYLQLLPLFKN